jgi:hypothetical protein
MDFANLHTQIFSEHRIIYAAGLETPTAVHRGSFVLVLWTRAGTRREVSIYVASCGFVLF